MSIFDSIRGAGGDALRFGGNVLRTGERVGSNVVDGAQRTGQVVGNGLQLTGRVAVESARFQANLTRAGLERVLDGAQTVGSTAARLGAAGLNRATHPGNPNPPAAQGLSFAETKGAAGLAYDAKKGEVYTFPDGKKWEVVDVQDDNKSGFRAIALRPQDANDRRVVVAFAGTRDGKDWKNNIGQGLGLPTRQYRQAVAFADKWKTAHGGNVILTGHSLGGGLASYASIKTGLRATAVNSAPLALNHLGLNPKAASRITQYYVPGEALSVLNAKNPLDIRPGNQIAVQGRNSILDPRSTVSNHSLENTAPGVGVPKKD